MRASSPSEILKDLESSAAALNRSSVGVRALGNRVKNYELFVTRVKQIISMGPSTPTSTMRVQLQNAVDRVS